MQHLRPWGRVSPSRLPRLRLAALTVMRRCLVTVMRRCIVTAAAALMAWPCTTMLTTVMATPGTTRATIIATMRATQCIGIIDQFTLPRGISQDIDIMAHTPRDFTGLLRSQRIGHFSRALRTGVHVRYTSRARYS